MKKNQINHNVLIHLVEANSVSKFTIKATGDTWTLTVQVGDALKIVMAKNSGKPRVWRKLDTVAKYLKGLGVTNFNTDVSEYDPLKKSLRRPDSANTLKQAHQSHQTLQKRNQVKELDVNIENSVVKKDPVKKNATDKAMQIAKERWEHQRAKLLEEEKN